MYESVQKFCDDSTKLPAVAVGMTFGRPIRAQSVNPSRGTAGGAWPEEGSRPVRVFHLCGGGRVLGGRLRC